MRQTPSSPRPPKTKRPLHPVLVELTKLMAAEAVRQFLEEAERLDQLAEEK